METCEICVERINKSSRKKAECTECDVVVCIKCAETQLRLSDSSAVKCVKCPAVWDREFVARNFKPKFMRTTYAHIRGKHILNGLKAHKVVDTEIARVNTRIKGLNSAISTTKNKLNTEFKKSPRAENIVESYRAQKRFLEVCELDPFLDTYHADVDSMGVPVLGVRVTIDFCMVCRDYNTMNRVFITKTCMRCKNTFYQPSRQEEYLLNIKPLIMEAALTVERKAFIHNATSMNGIDKDTILKRQKEGRDSVIEIKRNLAEIMETAESVVVGSSFRPPAVSAFVNDINQDLEHMDFMRHVEPN